MKKLSLLLFTVLLIIGVKPYNNVSAAITHDIDFTCNITYTEHAVEGILFFGESATDVTIYLPENASTIRDNGNHILKVWFYDEDGIMVDAFNVDDVFGPEFEDDYNYYIDFYTLGIDITAVSLKYVIPMGIGVACDVDTETYYNDNSEVTIGYTGITYGRFGWTYLENPETSYPDDYFLSPYLVSSIIDIPSGTSYINLAKIVDIKMFSMGYYSTIEFFNPVGVSAGVFNLDDLRASQDYTPDTIDIEITLLDNFEEFASFRIIEVFNSVTPDRILLNNVGFTYNFDNAVLPIVNFWVDGVVDYNVLAPVGSYVEYSSAYPTKVGYDFIEWVYHDNTPYSDWDPLDGDYFINGEINLYAVFRVIPTDLVGAVDDFVADEESKFTVAMTSLGFNDPIERTIVFGFVVILSSLLLLFKGASNVAILIVVTCELLFFMYLGVLPLFASIIIGLILLLIGFKTIGGGANE